MKTRSLGNSEHQLSVLGIGTWAIGGAEWDYGWGQQDDKASIESILFALDNGFNWIDTAACYGLGHSEEIVGKALKEFSSKVFVATKCGLVPAGKGAVKGCLKKDSIIKECEDSLRRLQLDCIDLYQIHWPNPSEDIVEAFAAMQTLKEQGKILLSGVSNFSIKQMQNIQAAGEISSLQPPYNMINRRIEEYALPWCFEKGIGVLAYSPLGSGLFTGKMSRQRVEEMSMKDWRRSKNPSFCEPELSINLKMIESLMVLAEENMLSISELALSWVLRRAEVTSAIVGFRSAEQVEGLLKAGSFVMTDKLASEIENLLDLRKKELRQIS